MGVFSWGRLFLELFMGSDLEMVLEEEDDEDEGAGVGVVDFGVFGRLAVVSKVVDDCVLDLMACPEGVVTEVKDFELESVLETVVLVGVKTGAEAVGFKTEEGAEETKGDCCCWDDSTM